MLRPVSTHPNRTNDVPRSRAAAPGRVWSALLLLLLVASAAQAVPRSWDGPGLGGVWSTAANWNPDGIPAPGDDITIAGATVGIGDARMVSGSLMLADNALLNVTGVGASLTVTGAANIDNGRLFALNGGLIDLSTVTSFRRTRCEPNSVVPVVDFITVGSAGSIDLSGLQTLAVDVPGCPKFDLGITVLIGGMLDLSSLQSITPSDPHTVTITDSGTIDLQQLATMQSTMLSVNDVATVDLPSLTTLRGGHILVVNGQRVTANALTNASDVLFLTAPNDAIVMNALTTLSGARVFLNSSHLAFPALTTLLNTSIQIQDGGVLDVPQLTSYTADRGGALLTGGILNAPALRNLTNINLGVAETIKTMSLPGVTSYTWTLCEGLGLGSITAGGGGSIDLSGLQTFTIDTPGCGMLGYNIGAVTGGTINFSSLKTIVIPGPQILGILAGNPGSVIDLSSLMTFPAARVLFLENDGGRIIRPADGGGGGGGGARDFSVVRSRLSDLRNILAGGGLDQRARTKLGKLLTKAEKKLAAAEAGSRAGKEKRVKRGLKQALAKLGRFGALVGKLQPEHITDPAVGAALSAGAGAAVGDIATLQAAGGVSP